MASFTLPRYHVALIVMNEGGESLRHALVQSVVASNAQDAVMQAVVHVASDFIGCPLIPVGVYVDTPEEYVKAKQRAVSYAAELTFAAIIPHPTPQ